MEDTNEETGACCGFGEVGPAGTTARDEKLLADLTKRLNCIEGQIRRIKGMLEKNAYCDDVLNQISAVRAALGSVNKMILESHIRGCDVSKIKNGEDGVVEEFIGIVKKLL